MCFRLLFFHNIIYVSLLFIDLFYFRVKIQTDTAYHFEFFDNIYIYISQFSQKKKEKKKKRTKQAF